MVTKAREKEVKQRKKMKSREKLLLLEIGKERRNEIESAVGEEQAIRKCYLPPPLKVNYQHRRVQPISYGRL